MCSCAAHLKDQFPGQRDRPLHRLAPCWTRLINKEQFYELCDQHGIDHPATFIYDRSMGHDFTLPFEPALCGQAGRRRGLLGARPFPGVKKVFILPDLGGAAGHALDQVYAAGYPDHMVLQEFIPGDDSYMRVLTNYSDRRRPGEAHVPGPRAAGGALPHGIGNHAVIITEYDEALCLKIKTLPGGAALHRLLQL